MACINILITETFNFSWEQLYKMNSKLDCNSSMVVYFFPSIWLDDPQVTNEHRTQDRIAS